NDLNGGEGLPESLRVNPFTVPDLYFERLNRITLQRCQHVEATEAALTVPTEYFVQLQERILSKVAEEKLRKKISEPGFTVPEHYFTTLQKATVDKVIRRQTTPPVRSLFSRSWIRYAAAACIIMALSISGYFRFINTPAESHHLDAVSDQEILSYLEFYGEPSDITYLTEYLKEERNIADELNNLSEEDIEAYLNNMLRSEERRVGKQWH